MKRFKKVIPLILLAAIAALAFAACGLLNKDESPKTDKSEAIQEKLEKAGYIVEIQEPPSEENSGVIKMLLAVKESEGISESDIEDIIFAGEGDVDGIMLAICSDASEALNVYNENKNDIGGSNEYFKNGKSGVQNNVIYVGSSAAVKAVWPDISFDDDELDSDKIQEKLEKAGYIVEIQEPPSEENFDGIINGLSAVKESKGISESDIEDIIFAGEGDVDGILLAICSDASEARKYYNENKNDIGGSAGYFKNGKSGVQNNVIYAGSSAAVKAVWSDISFDDELDSDKTKEELEDAGYIVQIRPDAISIYAAYGLSAVKESKGISESDIEDIIFAGEGDVDGIMLLICSDASEALNFYNENKNDIEEYAGYFKNGKSGVRNNAVYFGSSAAVKAVWPDISL